jgi:hypothetical protein
MSHQHPMIPNHTMRWKTTRQRWRSTYREAGFHAHTSPCHTVQSARKNGTTLGGRRKIPPKYSTYREPLAVPIVASAMTACAALALLGGSTTRNCAITKSEHLGYHDSIIPLPVRGATQSTPLFFSTAEPVTTPISRPGPAYMLSRSISPFWSIVI